MIWKLGGDHISYLIEKQRVERKLLLTSNIPPIYHLFKLGGGSAFTVISFQQYCPHLDKGSKSKFWDFEFLCFLISQITPTPINTLYTPCQLTQSSEVLLLSHWFLSSELLAHFAAHLSSFFWWVSFFWERLVRSLWTTAWQGHIKSLLLID